MTDGPPPAAGSRRRPRRAASEVRDRMFEAAKDIIRTQGLTVSLEGIAMDDIVKSAGVARSSAYRLWPYKDLFVNDLLLNFAGPRWMTAAGTDADALLTAIDVVLEHWDLGSTADGRRAVLLEAVRQSIARNMRDVAQSVEFEIFTALMATGRGNGNDLARQELAAELDHAEASFIDQMTTFYEALGEVVGLRPREARLSFRHLAIAGGAAVQGLALRQKIVLPTSSEDAARDRADTLPGPGIEPGSTVEWTLAAFAFLGVFDAIAELDPDWTPTDERRRALEQLAHEIRAGQAP